MLETYEQHSWAHVVAMTGPVNFHGRGVAPVLARNGCTLDNRTAAAEGLQLVRQGFPCAQTQSPEPIGVVQVRRPRVAGVTECRALGPHAFRWLFQSRCIRAMRCSCVHPFARCTAALAHLCCSIQAHEAPCACLGHKRAAWAAGEAAQQDRE